MDRRTLVTLSTLLVASTTSCQDGTGPGGFVVTGHIRNNTQAAIPANARVVAVWGVTYGSPDYSYVFGAGTIDRFTGTFRIRFDEAPPLDALNGGALGVGFIVATTNDTLQDGYRITSSGLTGILGVTGQHAVIFVQNRTTASLPDWVATFEDGYSVGVGVKVPGAIFDIFQPASPSSPLLILDDLANIEVVNWT